MFLVNDEGITKTVDCKVILRYDDRTCQLCSTLREVQQANEQLQVELTDKSCKIEYNQSLHVILLLKGIASWLC